MGEKTLMVQSVWICYDFWTHTNFKLREHRSKVLKTWKLNLITVSPGRTWWEVHRLVGMCHQELSSWEACYKGLSLSPPIPLPDISHDPSIVYAPPLPSTTNPMVLPNFLNLIISLYEVNFLGYCVTEMKSWLVHLINIFWAKISHTQKDISISNKVIWNKTQAK